MEPMKPKSEENQSSSLSDDSQFLSVYRIYPPGLPTISEIRKGREASEKNMESKLLSHNRTYDPGLPTLSEMLESETKVEINNTASE